MKKYKVTRQIIQTTLNYWVERKKKAEKEIKEYLEGTKKGTWDNYNWECATLCQAELIIADLKNILNILDDELDAPFET